MAGAPRHVHCGGGAATGFMPDEEGLALAAVAERRHTGGRLDPCRGRRLLRAVHPLSGCGHRPGRGDGSGHCRDLQRRPPSWVRGEPGRLGASRRVARGSLDRPHRHACPSGEGPWRRPVSRTSWIAVVGDSSTIAARWEVAAGLVFIDGGHGEAPAWADYRGWAPRVAGRRMACHPRRLP